MLESLLYFLSDMASYHEENQMTASNLAMCFAPSLFNIHNRYVVCIDVCVINIESDCQITRLNVQTQNIKLFSYSIFFKVLTLGSTCSLCPYRPVFSNMSLCYKILKNAGYG